VLQVCATASLDAPLQLHLVCSIPCPSDTQRHLCVAVIVASAHHQQTNCKAHQAARLVAYKLFTRGFGLIWQVECLQDDYRAWELPHRDAPPPVAPRVSVPFDAETSYHDTYHAHPLEAPTRHHAEPWKGMLHTPIRKAMSPSNVPYV